MKLVEIASVLETSVLNDVHLVSKSIEWPICAPGATGQMVLDS